MYRKLEPQRLFETVVRLEKRIAERFPNAGLLQVCREILGVTKEAEATVAWIAKPLLWLRVGIAVFIFLVVGGIVVSIQQLPVQWGHFNLGEMLQILEATTNEIVLIGAAVFFLLTLESRVKRARALKALYVLRSISHVIDMHQLTKDPSRDVSKDTKSSPKVPLTRFELIRYLDYCSEMLSLVGKIGALYAQVNRDEVVLATINELELLTSNLSSQLWQKISILHSENSVEEEVGKPIPAIPPASPQDITVEK
jgi:hypothetical protein